MSDFHTPVLVDEVIDALRIERGKKYIDATIGGAGHGVHILKRGGRLLGIDQDPDAIRYSIENVKCQIPNAKWGEDIKIIQGNFRNIDTIAKENGFESVNGILFDLGVSSHQLDTPSRGFSYRFDAPIDLRFHQGVGEAAYQLIDRLTEEEFYEIFTRYSEEEHARAIAHAIVRTRRIKPIVTTKEMYGLVSGVVKDKKRVNETLSRVFQALRIVVNDEKASLTEGLKHAQSLLVSGGRLVVISFHSGEDRKVKQFMKGHGWRNITKKPISVSKNELFENPRSSSAKLRVAEKIV